jgi:hypothetical protein
MTILEEAFVIRAEEDLAWPEAFLPGVDVFLLARLGMVEVGAYLLEIVADLILHHFFGIQMALALKSLDGRVGDVVHVHLGAGATAQRKKRDQCNGGEKNSAEQFHPTNLEDPDEKAIQEGGEMGV